MAKRKQVDPKEKAKRQKIIANVREPGVASS